MEERFAPVWLSIREFEHSVPRCMYHKENDGGSSNGCTAGDSGDPLKNLHVLARTELLIDKKRGSGEKASREDRRILTISADDYYKLYVNGEYVAQGPAPAWPEKYYYNEIDLSPYLREGRNVLALHLYYQGLINRVWNSGDGRFAFACGMEGTTFSWKYEICHAYSGTVTGYDTQYLEDFDSRKWREDWKEPEFDDSGWTPVVRAGWADYRCVRQPTDMLQVYRKTPARVEKTSYGWFIDMGQEITGALRVRAEAEKDGAKAVIRCAEELEEKTEEYTEKQAEERMEKQPEEPRVRYRMRCNCQYEETWTLREGNCQTEPYDYKAFRYAEILCGDDVSVTEIEAEVRHYPMDEELCVLSSGDPMLDQIFQICKNGVKYGTQEGYLDCPTREKGQYLGDAIVASRAQVWLTGDTRMLRKCIDQFASTSAVCPGIMAVAPSSYMQEIADFSLLWSQMLLTDYQFTGDQEFLSKYYPTAKGIVEYFRAYARKDGLLENVGEKWNLVDWPENLRDGYDFPLTRPVVGSGCHNVINALYIGAVRTLAEIEKALGMETAHIGEWNRLKNSFMAAFYNEEKGLFRDSTTSEHCALHSNIYPLYFGICPQERTKRIADFLVEKGLSCGVLTGYFYLKALAAARRYDDVYKMLVNESEHGWVNMIREGATTCWEAWGKEQKWNTSLCHPWASGPIPVIIEDIAGYIPDPEQESGYRYEPHVPEELRASFQMKTPFHSCVES